MALLCDSEGRSNDFPVKEARDMKMRYLLVDGDNHLILVHREHVEAIWRGRVHVAEFGCARPDRASSDQRDVR